MVNGVAARAQASFRRSGAFLERWQSSSTAMGVSRQLPEVCRRLPRAGVLSEVGSVTWLLTSKTDAVEFCEFAWVTNIFGIRAWLSIYRVLA